MYNTGYKCISINTQCNYPPPPSPPTHTDTPCQHPDKIVVKSVSALRMLNATQIESEEQKLRKSTSYTAGNYTMLLCTEDHNSYCTLCYYF